MLTANLLFGKRKTRRAWKQNALDGLLGAAEFEAVLERERSRADRSGERFSLLAFRHEGPQNGRPVLAEVAGVLRGRLRATDEAGWLDGRRIGAMLPSTPAEGARILADEILGQLPDGAPRPLCQISCYPCGPSDGERRSRGAQAAPRKPPAAAPLRAVIAGTAETLFMRPLPFWKRSIDVAFSSAALVVLLPLFAVVGLAIKLTSPGPIFYLQRRSGRGGIPFVMYKFRSMVDGAEAARHELASLNEQDGPAFKIKADPRVTAVGRALRATCIDELPQMWNVLRGDMTLVGPRPLPCEETDGCIQWHRRRLDVTPGLTCTWQTSDRSEVTFDEWMRMDVRYIRNRTLWQDLKLVAATVRVVVRGDRY
jgi:lipopolysaccharide/colanic/teichoic acid biosynthesis glycosyltransferase